MADAYITRRGGINPLNFKVVGGTSAPSNPKENTIWVDTDTEIAEWHFGAEEPNVVKVEKGPDLYMIIAPHKLSAGDILNFTIPATASSVYEAIRIYDPGLSKYYCVRQHNGTVLTGWFAGVRVCVRISDDINTIGDWSGNGTAYLIAWDSYYHPDGIVWIQTGTSSPVKFNALKKNGIQVYPLSAKQYVGGAWVAKTAKSYQSDAWKEWSPAGALYYNGDQCVGTSGGWNARGWVNSGTIPNTIVPSVAFNADHMQITLDSGNLVSGAVEVVKDQDLTSVSKLTIDFEATTYAYQVRLLVIPRSTSYLDEAVCSVDLQASGGQTTVARRTVSLDVSGVSGSYDVVIAFVNAWSGGCNATMKVYSVLKE